MGDTNWKNWIILFIVAIGLTFEVMKRTTLRPDKSLEAAAAAGVVEPYSVGTETAARQRRQRPAAAKVGANADRANRDLLEKFIAANAPGTTTFDAAKKAAEAKKKKEECDEKNPKIDPLTGKPIACKKKKEKKDEKAEAPAVPNTPLAPEKPNEEAFYPQAIPGGELAPQQQAQKADDGFTSLEDWQRRLLNSPDPKETKAFIDKYKQNLVTADVFYKITQMMLDDSREEMKQMGVMCAGQTPSTTSFDLLASLIKVESSGSSARRDAEVYVARYADLSNVRILEALLRAPGANNYTTVLAAQKVGDSARHYLTMPSAANNTNVTTGAPATASATATAQIAAVKKNATYFQRFLGILQDLSRNADSSVKTQATSTLSNIQTLLASVQQQQGTTTSPVASTN